MPAASAPSAPTATPTSCLAYVFGTSSCTMTTTREPVFVPGVWGPYFSAMVPGAWLNEGGQSAAGAAIEQLLALHPAPREAHSRAQAAGQSLPAWLAEAARAARATACRQRRRSPTACTSCPSSSATARRSPTRTHAP